MAEIVLPFKVANHTDPVTRKTVLIVRNAHNHQSSTRLKNFQDCMKGLDGATYRGGDAVQNSKAVRAGFTSRAKGCAGRGGGRMERRERALA